MRIGIDPGIHGAIAFIFQKEIILKDMPTMEIPWAKTTKYKTMIDPIALWNMLTEYEDDEPIERITIEIVGVRAGQGISSNAVLVGAFYSVYSIASLVDTKVVTVQPAVWKRKYGLIGMDKDYSRVAALNMYPHLLPQLKRKKDVDRAEALLIGGY